MNIFKTGLLTAAALLLITAVTAGCGGQNTASLKSTEESKSAGTASTSIIDKRETSSSVTLATLQSVSEDKEDIDNRFIKICENWPIVLDYYKAEYFEGFKAKGENGIYIMKFCGVPGYRNFSQSDTLYFAWCDEDKYEGMNNAEGDYWFVYQYLGSHGKYSREIRKSSTAVIRKEGTVLMPGPTQSMHIRSVLLEGDGQGQPVILERTCGDLWMNTWADNGRLYTSWGDGMGFTDEKEYFTDFGVAVLEGDPPSLRGRNVYLDPVPEDPKTGKKKDDKPSSLLYVNGLLYAHMHSPLGDPDMGYISVSDDYGASWKRLMDKSPWTKKNMSNFRCMFFINMGRNYSLNRDGFVYAFGIGREWDWDGYVYLARVPRKLAHDYGAYEYLTGTDSEGEPSWSGLQGDARPLDGIYAFQQFSAMYHPGMERYVAITKTCVYDAPHPWGPWTAADIWLKEGWIGYQPGIIARGTGKDSFWFTISGQPELGDEVPYRLCMGRIVMKQ